MAELRTIPDWYRYPAASTGRRWLAGACACLAFALFTLPAAAQTITVVGTPHLTGLDEPPSQAQFAHTVEKLSAFEPTQVCVERMSGERIETLIADPARHGFTLKPETHGRPLPTTIVPLGIEMQSRLDIRAADARDEAAELAGRAGRLDAGDRIRLIALQLAGFEFHSAVLNWSYLDEAARERAAEELPSKAIEALGEFEQSVHEVYSLGVPLARKAGLRELCTADSLEDESRGMQVAMAHGGQAIIDAPEVQARIQAYLDHLAQHWRADTGPAALTELLRFHNSEAFAAFDREHQWETLLEFDNEAGAFKRRLMYWHARTAEISAELFRALAQGPEERVIFIIGAAHRAFTEADLRAQPWVEVRPALELLEAR